MLVELLTAAGSHTGNVTIPDADPNPSAIIWGVRCFVRQDDGSYKEGTVVYPSVVFPVSTEQPLLPFVNAFTNYGKGDLT